MSGPKALEGVVIQVPLEAKIAAKALRTAAYQLQGEPADEFRALADRVEKYWDAGCCSVCEETWCDDGCPLEDVRAEAMKGHW